MTIVFFVDKHCNKPPNLIYCPFTSHEYQCYRISDMKLFKIIGLILVLSPLGQAFGVDQTILDRLHANDQSITMAVFKIPEHEKTIDSGRSNNFNAMLKPKNKIE